MEWQYLLQLIINNRLVLTMLNQRVLGVRF